MIDFVRQRLINHRLNTAIQMTNLNRVQHIGDGGLGMKTTMSAEALQAPAIDKAALKVKYAEERSKRLRADGNAQYLQVKGHLGRYLDDPYTPRVEREPVTDHVTFAFVGGGFAGLVTGARLKEAGVQDVRIIEKGGDFGGTLVLEPVPRSPMRYGLDGLHAASRGDRAYAHREVRPCTGNLGAMPADRPPIQPLRRRSFPYRGDGPRLGRRQVGVWVIHTNRGDRFTASFIGLGTGPLHVPKLPGIPGIDRFKGHSFHTSRWDYDYTGGDPKGGLMTKLADKRVAIIGTGATSVQAVPHLARACKTLYVVQRTPSSVDVRANQPIDPDWFAQVATAGWQQRWLENFTANQAGGVAEEDLVQDGWTDLSRRIRSKIMLLPREEMTPQNMLAAYEDSDFEKMEEIRLRVDSLVGDPKTAQSLKAWYRQLCKRPCFHDAYLQAFNEAGAHLIDTDGQGVEAITETGIVVAGVAYEVDCIIYASGFEVGTEYRRRAGFDVTGRDGLTLSQAWGEGMRSQHGVSVHGFPNAFFVQPTQGANLISNVPHNLTESGKTIATIVKHAVRWRVSRGRGDAGRPGEMGRALVDRRRTDDRSPPIAPPDTITTRGKIPGRERSTMWGIPLAHPRFSNIFRRGETLETLKAWPSKLSQPPSTP